MSQVNSRTPDTSSPKRIRLALAGDIMLGRDVADTLAKARSTELISREVVEMTRSADLFILNLECCISERGSRWLDPGKPFFFRALPVAAELLDTIGVDCVTLANNHALDFGPVALIDTLDWLAGVGIDVVGAGKDQADARRPIVLSHEGFSLEVVGFTDHPRSFEAKPASPGVGFADLSSDIPRWLEEGLRSSTADATLVTPHWGPNMTNLTAFHLYLSQTSSRATHQRNLSLFLERYLTVFKTVLQPISRIGARHERSKAAPICRGRANVASATRHFSYPSNNPVNRPVNRMTKQSVTRRDGKRRMPDLVGVLASDG